MTTSDTSGNGGAAASVGKIADQARPAPAIGWAGWLLIVLALVLGLGFGAWATHYWLGQRIQASHAQQQQVLQRTLDRMRADLVAQQTRADTLAGQLVIERSTLQGLEAALQKAQVEAGLERDKVAFYEQLIPPGPQGSVAVRALDIQQQGPMLHYRAVLMRNAQQQKPFSGRLQFIAKGKQKGENVQLELLPARASSVAANGNDSENGAQPPDSSPDQQLADAQAAAAGQALLQVSFEQFQRSTGLLQLPADFLPLQVTLNVLEGDTVRASRTVKLGSNAPG